MMRDILERGEENILHTIDLRLHLLIILLLVPAIIIPQALTILLLVHIKYSWRYLTLDILAVVVNKMYL